VRSFRFTRGHVFIAAYILVLFVYIYESSFFTYPEATSDTLPTPTPAPTPLSAIERVYRRGKASCVFPPLKEKRALPDVGHVCVVIRSYHGHVNTTGPSLATLYHCLEQMEYPNWSSYVFYVDDHKVYDFNLVGEARPETYRSRYHVVDTPFHFKWECGTDCGYKSTDFVIYNYCPKDSRWLLVTNGDNEYSPDFFTHLDTQYDAIGFNWFTREKGGKIFTQPNITQPLCDEEWRSCCMRNEWTQQKHDLGSVIWNYQRFMKELKSYAKFNPHCCQDGALAEENVKNGNWKAKEVTECLFSHNPNPWSNCMRDKMKPQE